MKHRSYPALVAVDVHNPRSEARAADTGTRLEPADHRVAERVLAEGVSVGVRHDPPDVHHVV